MKPWCRAVRVFLGCLAITVPARLASADNVIPTNSPGILLGMSAVLSGPAQDLGRDMRMGMEAALLEVNRSGGIFGRRLELVALDDGYEPSRAVPNVRELIERRKVIAIVGNVGTPTAVACLPIAVESKTPFYGAFTGAGILRSTPPNRYAINFRASYAEETAAMVDALVRHAGVKPSEIAFFTQRDAYGDAGFRGGTMALRRHQLTNELEIVHVRYERNTLAVEKALATLIEQEEPPKAVIMVGAYAPCAQFIRLARKHGLDAIFLNVSFVGSTSLARALGDAGDGVVVTQVVPHYTADLPIVSDYRAAFQRLDPSGTPSFGSLEGYVAVRILCRALASISGVPDREKVVDSLEALGTFDIGLGETLTLSKDEHQACHHVWPTVVKGGRVVPFDWKDLGRQRSSRE